MERRLIGAVLTVVAVAALLPASAPAADSGATLLLSRPSGLGALPAASTSFNSTGARSLSDDGRFVVFASESDGLSPNDDDNFANVFLRDTQTQTTTLLSRSTGGQAANSDSTGPTISADGTRVAFSSSASNLDPADTDSEFDVFLHTVSSGATQLVSRQGAAAGGAPGNGFSQNPSLSADGQQIAFESGASNLDDDDTNDDFDVFVRQLVGPGAPTTFLVSRAQGDDGAQDDEQSFGASIDAGGTRVAFTSEGELESVGGVLDTNTFTDVYLRDFGAPVDRTYLISRADSGADPVGNGNSRQASLVGELVAFSSTATNLNSADTTATEDVHVRNNAAGATAGTTTLASRANGATGDSGDRSSSNGSLNGAGDMVVFETDSTNLSDGAPAGVRSVHIRDLGAGTTKLVSRASGASGTPADGFFSAISEDGGHVAFTSAHNDLSDADDNDFDQVFVRRLGASSTEFVSRPNGTGPFRSGVSSASLGSGGTSSADGRYVVFQSASDLLFPGPDEDGALQVYRRDLLTGDTLLVSRGPGADGLPGSRASSGATISADGSRVAFTSTSSNLASGDTGTGSDAFVRDITAATTVLATRADGPDGTAANNPAGLSAAISGDGRRVAFSTSVPGLAPGDSSANTDVLVRDLPASTTTLVSRADGPNGAHPGNAFGLAIDFDGDRVAFGTSAPLDAAADSGGTLDVYVRDVGANTTRLVSRSSGNGPASGGVNTGPDISADGARVLFFSSTSGLASGDGNGGHDAFVHDLGDGSTTLASRADGPDGAVGDLPAGLFGGLSADGTKVAFSSRSTNLGTSNPGGHSQVYLRDLATGATRVVSRADGAGGALGNEDSSFGGRPNANGDCVAFVSRASNLTAEGYGGTDHTQVYLRAMGGPCPVPAPPGGGGGGGGAGGTDQPVAPGTTADTLDPVLDRLALTNKRFRVGSAATPVAAGSRRRRSPAGTRFRWRLSEAATVSLRIERKLAGRRKGRRCVKPTRKLRKAKKCTRWSRAGTLTRTAKAGTGGTAFSGRIGRKKLAVGSYRAVVSSKDAAGNKSRTRTVTFKIQRR